MSTSRPPGGFDLLVERGFLDAETCGRVLAEVRAAPGRPASVYGRGGSGAVDERVRRTTRVEPSAEAEGLIRRLLLGRMRDAGAHFGLALAVLDEVQFLRYGVGGHFVAHQDGNTGMLRSEREGRRVSAVLFLNTQGARQGAGDYGGGTLVFHPRGAGERLRVPGEAGTLLLFRAETTHEVEPVTRGERYSVASWYR